MRKVHRGQRRGSFTTLREKLLAQGLTKKKLYKLLRDVTKSQLHKYPAPAYMSYP